MKWRVICLAGVLTVAATRAQAPTAAVDISPDVWPKGECERFLAAQDASRQ